MSCFGRCFNNFHRNNSETNFSNSLRQIRVHNHDQVDLTKSVKIPDKMAKRLGKINVILKNYSMSKRIWTHIVLPELDSPGTHCKLLHMYIIIMGLFFFRSR